MPQARVGSAAFRLARKACSSLLLGLEKPLVWIPLASLCAAAGLSLAYYYRPRHLDLQHPGIAQSVTVSLTGTRVFVPNRVLTGKLAEFNDGFFAFLMFDYLRGRPGLSGRTVMLTSTEEQGPPLYRVLVRLPDDLVEGVNILGEMKVRRLTPAVRFEWVPRSQLDSWIQETSVFEDAYKGTASKRLERLHASELQRYLREFIRFKSDTDPRRSTGSDPIPSPLNREDASRLAADIIAVARFYDVPISLFLGIGAMENNYLNVPGDRNNTIWKPQAQPGDIVIRRRGGRVLVRNDSTGVWQITRESLRYAHRLYLRDKRDYNRLPARLRPPAELDVDSVTADVLTTYAGLLLRNLLDQFHGNIALTAGAYNGGPGKPNARYAAGVEMVASYARRVIGRAAEIDRAALERNSVSRGKLKAASVMMKKESAQKRAQKGRVGPIAETP